MDLGFIAQIGISIQIVIGLTFLYKYLKKLNGSVDNIKSYMSSIKMGYTILKQITDQQDKDPNTISNKEKIVEYVGTQVDQVDEFFTVQDDEFTDVDEKNRRLREFMIKKVKKSIQTYEGNNSDLLDEDKIQDVVDKLLDFIWPLVKPEKQDDKKEMKSPEKVTKVDLDSVTKKKNK